MSTPTVAGLQKLHNDAILKFQVGAMFVADDTAPLVTAPFDVSGLLQALPAGYQSAGSTDTAGLAIGRAITVAEVNIWQSVQPARSDVTGDKYTVKVKCEEVNPVTLAINEGRKLSAISLTPFFTAKHDSQGTQPKRRVLLLGEDTLRGVIMAVHFPNCVLTAMGSDQSLQRATEFQFDFQLDAYPDPLLLDDSGNPTDRQTWVGGSGWATLAGEEQPVIPAWAATTAYVVNDEVKLTGGAVLQATVAGTSGSTAPTAPAVGSTVTDGTVTWTRLS